ncbi:OLC1v1024205C1 [Oldenlandia corymbosa var. corymbosa]|uniref:3-hydroxyisobutyrate dehydrogenase n=1 Tax=Oldenlandia corymbosa var. corymbosa TaxID=529605 RepID=A0AAV1C4L3_OLDCO|nr:OLC1v1024205C1 [Oldenlandia corymbosa var. corymbosa]
MAIRRMRLTQQLLKFTSSVNHLPWARSFCSSSKIPSQFEKVGFIGLGNMGSRMAQNLIKDGFNVTVHDLDQNAMKIFSEKGIVTKDTPFEVAETSDLVITMLPSSTHVLDVYTGPNGMLQNDSPVRPFLFIDSSTIDPQTSRRVSATLSDCSLKEKSDSWEVPAMLDAPVSGGVLAAESGTLTFMVGGSEEAYVAAKPLLLSMGKNTIYCGGAGNGSAAKICNNLAMAVSMLGVSEALALGQKLGIASSTLTKVFNSSSARCWSSDTYNPVPGVMDAVPASRNYDGGFASKLMAKDLHLAVSSAKEVGLECPLTSHAEKMHLFYIRLKRVYSLDMCDCAWDQISLSLHPFISFHLVVTLNGMLGNGLKDSLLLVNFDDETMEKRVYSLDMCDCAWDQISLSLHPFISFHLVVTLNGMLGNGLKDSLLLVNFDDETMEKKSKVAKFSS